MSRYMLSALTVCGILVALPGQETASAQWYSGNATCQCVQPVVQNVYRTVPVTEYQQVKQVVQRPVVETKYVDRKVTEYRPVTETRTAEVPTVTYKNVTEQRTVQQDASYWQTRYYHNPKVSPCQYDPRPSFLGWLNRTGYSVRQAFTPNVVARREYVPQFVTQTVPVTRRVAQHGTRKVTYKVTRMVPHTTTKKVAVNTVRYVAEEVTTMRPVTVMRTVPIGTRMTYAPFTTTATALGPTPDPIGSAGRSSPDRTAEKSGPVEEYRRKNNSGPPADGASYTVPPRRSSERPIPQARNDGRYEGYRPVDDSRSTTKYPSVIRISRRWRSRRQSSAAPTRVKAAVSLVDGR